MNSIYHHAAAQPTATALCSAHFSMGVCEYLEWTPESVAVSSVYDGRDVAEALGELTEQRFVALRLRRDIYLITKGAAHGDETSRPRSRPIACDVIGHC